jgi:hypothetical protein
MQVEVYIGQNSAGYFVGHGGNMLMEHASIHDIQTILPGLDEEGCRVQWLEPDTLQLPHLQKTSYSNVVKAAA